MIKNVLIDTDVLLDVFLGREPHFSYSKTALLQLDGNAIGGFITSTIVVNVFYHIRKYLGVKLAFECVEDLLTNESIAVLDVNKTTLAIALKRGMSDFEDAVQVAAAETAGLDLIVTRNVRDFKNTSITALSPKDFLARIQQEI